MSTAGLFSIFLIGIASNLDNAGVGIAYGIRKIRISWFNNFIIAFFGFLFTLLAGFFWELDCVIYFRVYSKLDWSNRFSDNRCVYFVPAFLGAKKYRRL